MNLLGHGLRPKGLYPWSPPPPIDCGWLGEKNLSWSNNNHTYQGPEQCFLSVSLLTRGSASRSPWTFFGSSALSLPHGVMRARNCHPPALPGMNQRRPGNQLSSPPSNCWLLRTRYSRRPSQQLIDLVDYHACRRPLIILESANGLTEGLLNLRVLAIADKITDSCLKLLPELVDRAPTLGMS